MFKDVPFFQKVYFSNTLGDYAAAFLIFLAILIFVIAFEKIIVKMLKRLAEKTKTQRDDFILDISEKALLPVLYVSSFYPALHYLALNPKLEKLINALWIAILTVQVIRFSIILISHFLKEYWFRREAQEKGRISNPGAILTTIKVLLWGAGIIFMLDNLGFKISAVIAGLGIGGVAVALAAQTILGDLFNYFVILFDKPFEEGDFIILDNYLGVIEHIGIKTTRIRSLGGEQIVFSNSDLASNRIKNYKRMQKRRVLFTIGVTYQTSTHKLEKIPGIIRKIIETTEEAVFDRAHFQGFGNSSLNIEIVYYVTSGDYNKYMDIQQKINFAIKEQFEKEKIEFAYPTQTLFINK